MNTSTLSIFASFIAAVMMSASAVHASETAAAIPRQEEILLPIYLRSNVITGVNGSTWGTELVVYNRGTELVVFGPCNEPSDPECPPGIAAITPGETWFNHSMGFTNAGLFGRMVHVRHEQADDVVFNLRAVSRASTGDDESADLPVVRTADFATSTISLLNVPLGAERRTMLRVYDPEDRGDARGVVVRIYALDGDLLREDPYRFAPSGYPSHDGYPFAPSFIQIMVPSDVGEERVRIDIVPEGEGLRFWAFISLTDNRTQHVTIIAPE
jgi:hypothetical protein